jgi:hypothetical protein
MFHGFRAVFKSWMPAGAVDIGLEVLQDMRMAKFLIP